MQNTNFGRKKVHHDPCKNAKEALIWHAPVGPQVGKEANKKKSVVQKNQILMERSPEKWKTSYRDQYRQFTKSPQKGD